MKQNKFFLCSYFAFLIFAAAFVFSSCAEKKDALNTETEVVFAVNTYKTFCGNLDEYLEFGGDVASVSAVDVFPDVAGKILRILVNVGESVSKNQILAYVDASRPGLNYSASPVRSPIAGRVISFTPAIGSTVSQAMPIAQVGNTDDLEIRASVSERFVSRIQKGQQATAIFAAYPGVKFGAKVTEVSPVLDTSTRTMAIKLRFSPRDARIKVGMYGSIHLITESIQNAIVVPSDAIVTRNGEPYVFVAVRGAECANGETSTHDTMYKTESANKSKIENSKTDAKANDKTPAKNRNENQTAHATVKLQKVTMGTIVDNQTEIVAGIKAGEEIVVRGQSLLNDGDAVNIVGTVNENKFSGAREKTNVGGAR